MHADIGAEPGFPPGIAGMTEQGFPGWHGDILGSLKEGVIALDVDGRIRYMNVSAAATLGWDASETNGMKARDTLQCGWSEDNVGEATRDSGPGDLGTERVALTRETDFRRKDGSAVPVITSCVAIMDPSGKFRGQVIVFRDISRWKRALKDLEETERKYRTLLEASVEGILLARIGTRAIVYANPAACRMFGYSEEEFSGLRIEDMHPRTSMAPRIDEFERMSRKELDHLAAVPCLRKDGSTIFCDIHTAPVTVDGIECNLGFFSDVTEQKEVGEFMNQTRRLEAVGRLAGGVAHDFNNVLTIIAGYSDLLLTGMDHDDPRYRQVEAIQKAASHAAGLTQQLLAFSRRQVLQPRPLNLNEVIRSVKEMVVRLVGEDVQFETSLAGGLASVMADPTQLTQVIMNLAANARDAMPHGGRLMIETANVTLDRAFAERHNSVTSGPHVMLSARDTGTGMDAETQAHIFEPFYSTKTAGKGTGLGLSTTYGIVKQSGGTIWADSKPGEGTTFRIYLPCVAAEAHEVEVGMSVALRRGGGETILVVEDEPEVREIVSECLRRNGYRILEASNGTEGVEVFGRHVRDVDVVLTDIVMPGMGGLELVRQVRDLAPRAKVLLMSGYTDQATFRPTILGRNDHFIQKPFSQASLALKVKEVLGDA